MYKFAGTVLSFFMMSMAFAQNQGVEATNYSLEISAIDTDYRRSLELDVSARFPIYGYVGGQISGEISDYNGKDNYLDSSSYSGSFDLFMKKHDVGVITASFGRTHAETDSTYINSSINWDSYFLSGMYYFEDLNISLGRSGSKRDSGESYYQSFIGLSYYLTNNFLLGAATSDDDDHPKSFYVMFQPEAFSNSIIITGAYSDTDTVDSFLISLDYSFDLNVSLKDKARKY